MPHLAESLGCSTDMRDLGHEPNIAKAWLAWLIWLIWVPSGPWEGIPTRLPIGTGDRFCTKAPCLESTKWIFSPWRKLLGSALIRWLRLLLTASETSSSSILITTSVTTTDQRALHCGIIYSIGCVRVFGRQSPWYGLKSLGSSSYASIHQVRAEWNKICSA